MRFFVLNFEVKNELLTVAAMTHQCTRETVALFTSSNCRLSRKIYDDYKIDKSIKLDFHLSQDFSTEIFTPKKSPRQKVAP